MKAYDEKAKYILFINKLITILGCSTVNSLTIGFLGHIFQHKNVKPLHFFMPPLLLSLSSSRPRGWASIWCLPKVWWLPDQKAAGIYRDAAAPASEDLLKIFQISSRSDFWSRDL